MILELEAFCVCYVARERISSLLLHIIGTPYPIPDILILFCPIPNRKKKKFHASEATTYDNLSGKRKLTPFVEYWLINHNTPYILSAKFGLSTYLESQLKNKNTKHILTLTICNYISECTVIHLSQPFRRQYYIGASYENMHAAFLPIVHPNMIYQFYFFFFSGSVLYALFFLLSFYFPTFFELRNRRGWIHSYVYNQIANKASGTGVGQVSDSDWMSTRRDAYDISDRSTPAEWDWKGDI